VEGVESARLQPRWAVSTLEWLAVTGIGALVLAASHRAGLDPLAAPALAGLVVLAYIAAPVLRPGWVVLAALAVLMLLNIGSYSFLRVVDGSGMLAKAKMPLAYAAAVYAVFYAARRSRLQAVARQSWDLWLFGVAALCSGMLAADPLVAVSYALWLGVCLVLLILVLDAAAEGGDLTVALIRIASLLLVGYLPIVLLGVLALPSYNPRQPLVALYSTSNFHAYGGPVVIGAVVVLYFLRVMKHGGVLLRLAVPVASVATVMATAGVVVLSGKRSALAAAVVVLMLGLGYAVWSARKSMLAMAAYSLVGVATATVIWWIAQSSVFLLWRIATSLKSAGLMGNPERVEILQANLLLWRDNPIFGVGLLNSGDAIAAESLSKHFGGFSTHNTYLGVLSELGLVGVALFSIVVGRSVSAFLAIRTAGVKWGVAVLAAGPLLISVSEYNLTPGQALFWPFWLGILLPRIARLADSRSTPDREGVIQARYADACGQNPQPPAGVPSGLDRS
jgi:O-antigen ligase